jgi:ribonuclease-3
VTRDDARSRLEAELGAPFVDPAHLDDALVHRSYCAEHPDSCSNERLEFLGDAVLGLSVTVHVFNEYPDLPEGELSKRRASVVNAEVLADVAAEIGLGDVLLLGKGEAASGGREKPSILADAMEAIIGAVYLAKGLTGAAELVLEVMGPRLATAREDGADHKSRLQELAARDLGSAPRYEVEATGPDHARTFHVTVTIDGEPHGTGVGRSKKQAEQNAARDAIDALNDTTDGSDVDDTLREIHHG